MPYHGKPSTGCNMCRTRKVKCDEIKPKCTKCQKLGYDCVYRDAFELVHRNQTTVAARRAQTKWRERAAHPSPHSTTSADDPPNRSKKNLQWVSIKPDPKAVLQPSIHQLADLRFFYDFVSSNDNRSPLKGALELLPDVYNRYATDSSLHAAVSALSYANFAGRYHVQEATRLGAVSYGKALRMLATTPDSSIKMRLHETLLAIFLLGLYEVITSHSFDGAWLAHLSGSETMLRLHESDPVKDETRERFLSMTYGQQLIRHLGNYTTPPAHLTRIQDLLPKGSPESTLMDIMLQVAALCPKMKKQEISYQRRSWVSDFGTETYLAEAMDLDTQLETWHQNLPHIWSYTIQPLTMTNRPSWITSLFTLPGAPDVMHQYVRIVGGVGWNLYRVTRIHLDLTTLDLVSRIPSRQVAQPTPLQPTPESLARTITSLINDFCLMTPSTLQISPAGTNDPQTVDDIPGMRGYNLTWPLLNALKCFQNPLVRAMDVQGREKWIRAVMMFLGRALSIKKAEAFLAALPYVERGG